MVCLPVVTTRPLAKNFYKTPDHILSKKCIAAQKEI